MGKHSRIRVSSHVVSNPSTIKFKQSQTILASKQFRHRFVCQRTRLKPRRFRRCVAHGDEHWQVRFPMVGLDLGRILRFLLALPFADDKFVHLNHLHVGDERRKKLVRSLASALWGMGIKLNPKQIWCKSPRYRGRLHESLFTCSLFFPLLWISQFRGHAARQYHFNVMHVACPVWSVPIIINCYILCVVMRKEMGMTSATSGTRSDGFHYSRSHLAGMLNRARGTHGTTNK